MRVRKYIHFMAKRPNNIIICCNVANYTVEATHVTEWRTTNTYNIISQHYVVYNTSMFIVCTRVW